MSESDPAVRLEVMATACGLAFNSLRRARLAGRIPPPDTEVRKKPTSVPARAWKLSTVRAWNPAVAERCEWWLQALETEKPAA